jgi:hypothetical protein
MTIGHGQTAATACRAHYITPDYYFRHCPALIKAILTADLAFFRGKDRNDSRLFICSPLEV